VGWPPTLGLEPLGLGWLGLGLPSWCWGRCRRIVRAVGWLAVGERLLESRLLRLVSTARTLHLPRA
jgi:hypothetical protein